MSPGTIAASIGIEIGKRAVPRGLSFVWTYMGGRVVLVVGMARAGKSSFLDYLRYGILEKEGRTEKTVTLVTESTFQINMGREGSLQLKLRRTIDTPGQVGPTQHANLVGEKRPHALVVFLDSSQSAGLCKQWLKEFMERLDAVCRKKPAVLKRLNCIEVVLNKDDKLTVAQSHKRVSTIRQCVVKWLTPALGVQRAKRAGVLPCVSVENPDGCRLIDSVIRKLAKDLVDKND